MGDSLNLSNLKRIESFGLDKSYQNRKELTTDIADKGIGKPEENTLYLVLGSGHGFAVPCYFPATKPGGKRTKSQKFVWKVNTGLEKSSKDGVIKYRYFNYDLVEELGPKFEEVHAVNSEVYLALDNCHANAIVNDPKAVKLGISTAADENEEATSWDTDTLIRAHQVKLSSKVGLLTTHELGLGVFDFITYLKDIGVIEHETVQPHWNPGTSKNAPIGHIQKVIPVSMESYPSAKEADTLKTFIDSCPFDDTQFSQKEFEAKWEKAKTFLQGENLDADVATGIRRTERQIKAGKIAFEANLTDDEFMAKFQKAVASEMIDASLFCDDKGQFLDKRRENVFKNLVTNNTEFSKARVMNYVALQALKIQAKVGKPLM